MSNAFFQVPVALNEPVKAYAPGSAERTSLLAKYHEMYTSRVPIRGTPHHHPAVRRILPI